jgi:preprotein translocase subunit SecF
MKLMQYKKLYFLISALFLLPSIYALVFWGLKPSIDFTGGTILEVKNLKCKMQNCNLKLKIEEKIKEKVNISSIQESGTNTYILKMKEIDKDQKEELIEKLEEEFGDIEETRFETLGPSIGRELVRKTLMAIVLAAGFILLYVAWRFKDKKYGICAILAMFHDTIILLGSFAILGHYLNVEIDTLFVTAVLTILSFSVHDTVVVYDQIRQLSRQNSQTDFDKLVDQAVVGTLSRSINNSLTIIFMLLCLYFLGGQTIRWFSLALLIGTVAGTYSSTFTAAPLLIVWDEIKKRRK